MMRDTQLIQFMHDMSANPISEETVHMCEYTSTTNFTNSFEVGGFNITVVEYDLTEGYDIEVSADNDDNPYIRARVSYRGGKFAGEYKHIELEMMHGTKEELSELFFQIKLAGKVIESKY